MGGDAGQRPHDRFRANRLIGRLHLVLTMRGERKSKRTPRACGRVRFSPGPCGVGRRKRVTAATHKDQFEPRFRGLTWRSPDDAGSGFVASNVSPRPAHSPPARTPSACPTVAAPTLARNDAAPLCFEKEVAAQSASHERAASQLLSHSSPTDSSRGLKLERELWQGTRSASSTNPAATTSFRPAPPGTPVLRASRTCSDGR